MTRMFFLVVLVMALVDLAANVRTRRTFARIDAIPPDYLTTSLLSMVAVVVLALANLLGWTSRLGLGGLITSVAFIVVALIYAMWLNPEPTRPT